MEKSNLALNPIDMSLVARSNLGFFNPENEY